MASFFGPDANYQAKKFESDLRARGQNPGAFGMGTQQDRDEWAQQLQGQRQSTQSPQASTAQQGGASPPKVGGATNMSAWGNQGGAQQGGGSQQSSPWGQPRPQSQTFGAPVAPTFSWTDQQSQLGNLGNSQQGRPPGFQASYFDLQGNPVSFEQQQAQRGAMVNQLRQSELQYGMANAFNKNLGQPQYDFNSMLNAANQAVDNGFYNPFQGAFGQQQGFFGSAVRPSGFPAPPQNAVSDLFTRYGMNAPPGFMDELLGVLGQQAPPQRLGPQVMRPERQFDPFAPSDPGDWRAPPSTPSMPPRTGGDFQREPYSSSSRVPMSSTPAPGLVAYVLSPGTRSERTVYVTPEDAQSLARERPRRPGRAQPTPPPDQGTPYDPAANSGGLPRAPEQPASQRAFGLSDAQLQEILSNPEYGEPTPEEIQQGLLIPGYNGRIPLTTGAGRAFLKNRGRVSPKAGAARPQGDAAQSRNSGAVSLYGRDLKPADSAKYTAEAEKLRTQYRTGMMGEGEWMAAQQSLAQKYMKRAG